MGIKYCKVCKAVLSIDETTHKEFLNGMPHKSHGPQAFCILCQRYFAEVPVGFDHVLKNHGHRVHFWSEAHKEGAFVMGVPRSLL